MRTSHRILFQLFRFLWWLGIGRWVLGILLAIVGAGAFFLRPNPLLSVLCTLVLLLLTGGSILAAWQDYTIFLPDPSAARPQAGGPQPFAPGLASGLFWVWDGFKWLEPDLEWEAPVQVRWLDGERPPVLAVIRPVDLTANLKNPLQEADEVSLWHPGVEATPGRMLTRRGVFPAIRFRYFGKRLTLAVEREEQVGAIIAALAE